LKATEQPIDTSTAVCKCFLDMLGVFAEFETNLRRERQLEGIAKAKAAGVYKGRQASIDATMVRDVKAQGAAGRPKRGLARDRLTRLCGFVGRVLLGPRREPGESTGQAPTPGKPTPGRCRAPWRWRWRRRRPYVLISLGTIGGFSSSPIRFHEQ
jgi:hypothetical protein